MDRDCREPPYSLGLPFDDFIIFGSIISYCYPLQESCCYSFALISGDSLLMLMKVPVLIISECFRRLKPLDTAHWRNRLEYVVTTAIDFEAKHKECVRVLPYDDPAKVHFYVFSGKSGVPQKLKDAAQECFGEMKVKLEWFDLYNDATEILKVTPIEFPSGKPERLNESQIYKINEIINKNPHVLVKHRNVTAVQASFKIINSKQTKQPCIAIYVLGKGSIPVGEIEFPRTLGGYDVDVVDGFWFTTGEDDPWRPNEGQEQCEVLCLGASIGVEGEEGCGTLGAIVEGDGKFYALSCDHVMKRAQKSKIIHPARDDYLNYLNYHLQQYVERIQYIIKREQRFLRETISQFSFDSIKDLERLKLKFQELKSLKEEHYDQDRAKKGNLEKVELHEKALENGFKTPPRVIGRYIAGISRNMRWTDGQEYFIDAAVAELTPKEIKGLRESEKIEMIGTGKSPSGRCSSSFTAFGELCKSGRTTEYTNSGRHANPNVYLRLSSYRLNAQNKHLNDVVKRVSICHTCAYSAGVEEDLEPTFSPCGFCRVDTETLNDEVWLKNCLCIDRPYDPAKGDAFSAGGDSGAVIFEIEEKKSLLGFGIIFAQQCHSYGSCALASPLLPTLQTLSREIPVTESLSLSSNVVGIPSDSDTGESPWWCNIV